MAWPWVVMERAELVRLKGKLEETEELLVEVQREVCLQKERLFAAEHRVRALEARLEIKEKT